MAASITFAVAILLITALQGFAGSYLWGLLQRIAVGVAGGVLLGAFALAAGPLANWSQSEAEFEATVERAERLATAREVPVLDDEFATLVREAIDGLPQQFLQVLAQVPVVISEQGYEWHAYGLYQGNSVGRHDYPQRIVIYRDTLLRDFGSDRELLRQQVARTVRHEVAHLLGWDESGVRDLGL